MRILFAVVVGVVGCSSPGSQQQGNDVDAPPSHSDPDAPDTSSATCDGKMTQPLDATWNITVGSAMRVVRVHVPASYDPQKATPLLFDVHGRTQNASGEMSLTNSKAKSDAEGFIVVFPESATSPTAWNSGSCCDPANTNNIDDTAFMTKLLDEAESRLCIDAKRVYMMGMSNGGYESHRIGCELADRFAAVGPVAGLLLFQNCSPSRPMPIMMVNGTADNLSQYQYVDESYGFWKTKNKCSTMMQTYSKDDATCVTYGGCEGGADVVQCTIQDGGHQWPGGGTTLPFLGKKSDNLDTTSALWTFFKAHPLP
ncbi:MAG TPA: PHB depolymerase family esterase [Kofleriaceae bacterium]|jgi:polyhydroxybutyrate depolymerase|nr:PHB depolymerase family esterase [Kofleriaceae bacterium]